MSIAYSHMAHGFAAAEGEQHATFVSDLLKVITDQTMFILDHSHRSRSHFSQSGEGEGKLSFGLFGFPFSIPHIEKSETTKCFPKFSCYSSFKEN